MRFAGCAGIVLVVVYALIVAVIWGGGSFSAEVFGYATGGVLIPFVIAYLIAGRRSRRDWNRFARLFVWIGVGVLTMNAVSSLAEPPRNNVNEYVKRALTKAAAGQSGSGTEEVLFVDFFRDVITATRRYQDAASACNRYSPKAFTPESFAGAEVMDQTRSHLTQCVSLDLEHYEETQKILSAFRQKVAASDLSQQHKDEMLKGVDEGEAASMNAYGNVIQVERLWLSATTDLYQYSRDHAGQIHVRGGRVLISGDDVLAEFNHKLHSAQALHRSFLQANTQLEALRRETSNQIGFSPADLGLK